MKAKTEKKSWDDASMRKEASAADRRRDRKSAKSFETSIEGWIRVIRKNRGSVK